MTGTTWPGLYAVVYSYNRKELAAQCLAALQRQTVAPERIIFVDNGSTDGTQDYLAAEGFLADPRLDYVRLEDNTGAAGGLRTGITEAYRRGCAWAWVMDDDLICQPDTLAELRRAYEDNFSSPTQIGFLVSSLVNPEGRANNVPQIDERTEAADRCPEWGDLLARGLVRVRISTLTSIVLPRTTLERCGVPNPDFFLWGEDTDYTLRITDWRPGYLVGSSRAVHLRSVGGFLDIFTEDSPARIRNFYYLYRNTMFLRRRFWPMHGFALFLGKSLLHFCQALIHPNHRLLRAWTILAGSVAGLFFQPHPAPRLEAAAQRPARDLAGPRSPIAAI
jgi:dTDP-4-dehydrorhamnose reductase